MEAILLRQLISTSPAELLIASIWQGLLLTAFAWAALKLASGLRASTRFTLWMIVFLLVALLPCFAIGRGLFGAFPSPSSPAPQPFSLHVNVAWAFVLEVVWAFASLLSLGRLFLSGRQMRALLRNSVPMPFEALGEEIQSVVTRSGKRSVEVRLSDAVDAPSVIGFFRPAVVVPRSLWSELAPNDMKQIILHEMAHLDRGDDWTNLLQKLLRALSPLNPALVWAERHLCREREQACDDAVLDVAGNPRAYATCLTKLAENKLLRHVTSLAPGFWQRHSELAGRVENILHRRRNLGPMLSRGLVAAGLSVSLSGALVLQRFPGIVTFASNDSVAAAAPIARPEIERTSFERTYANQSQAHYQEAVFHPAVSQTDGRASVLPKPHSARPVHTSRRLQFVQLTEDQDGGGITLVLFTVEVPQKSQGSHGELLQTLPTPDSWIAFQI
jgi:beta-lactamase regulating signal transducer with metallopeptidase domain